MVGRGAPYGTVSPLTPKLEPNVLKGDRANRAVAAIVGRQAPHGTVSPLTPKLEPDVLKGARQ